MISGRKNASTLFQGPRDHVQHRPEHVFEDLICNPAIKVVVTESQLIIYAPNYRDYILARTAIMARTSLEITYEHYKKNQA